MKPSVETSGGAPYIGVNRSLYWRAAQDFYG